jgi:membrane protease YdiL (CAAX protease family)
MTEPMTSTVAERAISSDLSLTRLHLMRAGYLVIGVGLAFVKWPRLDCASSCRSEPGAAPSGDVGQAAAADEHTDREDLVSPRPIQASLWVRGAGSVGKADGRPLALPPRSGVDQPEVPEMAVGTVRRGDDVEGGGRGVVGDRDMTESAAKRQRWKPHGLAQRHPFATFVVIAYALSWTLFLVSYAGGGLVAIVLAGLGPMTAAVVVTRWTGGSLREWAGPILRWRVPVRWWAYALGLPVLVYAVVSLVLHLLGSPVDWSLVAGRAPEYAATFLFVLVLGGAMEEPGWRGFGLPLLLRRHSPVRATLILGLVWGFWHLPVYGPLGFVVPTVLAFFYTYLWARTGSVLLCILLHASFTPAQDTLILMPHDQAYSSALDRPDWVVLAVYVVFALLLVLATRGRLGVERPSAQGD